MIQSLTLCKYSVPTKCQVLFQYLGYINQHEYFQWTDSEQEYLKSEVVFAALQLYLNYTYMKVRKMCLCKILKSNLNRDKVLEKQNNWKFSDESKI